MEDRANTLQDLLKRVGYFSELAPESLRLLEDRMRRETFRPGETVFAEGDPGDHLYIVKSGQIQVLKRKDGHHCVPIDVLYPGDFGGMTGLVLREPRSATLRAINNVELWVLDRPVFEQLLNNDKAFARALLAYLSAHLRDESRILARLTAVEGPNALRVAIFDTKPYTRDVFSAHNTNAYTLTFFEHRLDADTVASATGHQIVCCFVNDTLNAPVVERLAELGIQLIAMRCAGYNNVDLAACERLGISVVHVPAYSPHSVAEHGIALMLALNRHIAKASARVREGNFSLDGLVGFEMRGKTVGVVGTGRIGRYAAEILLGFGCRVLGYDVHQDSELASKPGFQYTDLDSLLRTSDIVSLHVPLLPQTRYLVNADTIAKMKPGVMIINTSRGALIDTQALIDGLKSGQVGSAGLDVYEEEQGYFFEDFSDRIVADDTLARLLTFNNVLITSHQAFLTREALESIARTTLDNIGEFLQGKRGKELTHGICARCE